MSTSLFVSLPSSFASISNFNDGVFRHQAEGYLNVLTAERHQVARASPFDAVELRVAELLGEDPAENALAPSLR